MPQPQLPTLAKSSSSPALGLGNASQRTSSEAGTPNQSAAGSRALTPAGRASEARLGPQAWYKSRNKTYGSFYQVYNLPSNRLYNNPMRSDGTFSKDLLKAGFFPTASLDTVWKPDFEKMAGTRDWPHYLS